MGGLENPPKHAEVIFVWSLTRKRKESPWEFNIDTYFSQKFSELHFHLHLPTLRNTKQFGYEVENNQIFIETVEDWKEKYFSADATAEALKAELKLKQSNLDQVREIIWEEDIMVRGELFLGFYPFRVGGWTKVMSFYPDFMIILSWLYPIFILIEID